MIMMQYKPFLLPNSKASNPLCLKMNRILSTQLPIFISTHMEALSMKNLPQSKFKMDVSVS